MPPHDLAVDLSLLLGFAVPHSLLLRRGGYALVERFFPRPLFYTVYGLVASVSLLAVYALWRPLPGTVWCAAGPLAAALLLGHAGAWALMTAAFVHYGPLRQPGLEQWWAFVHGRKPAGRPFPTTGPYRFTRHPIYVAMFLMIWLTPRMTAGHLLLSVVWTAYLAVGIVHKEARLRRTLGEAWARYAAAVPAIPGLRFGAGRAGAS